MLVKNRVLIRQRVRGLAHFSSGHLLEVSFNAPKSSSAAALSSLSVRSQYRRSTLPSGVPLSKILSNSFPLSVSESIADFKNRKQLDVMQENLFSTLPFFPEPDLNRTLKFVKTVINDATGDYMNEFVIQPKNCSYEDCKHLVITHGYGAGMGFFLKNMDQISEYGAQNNWCIHAVDLFGFGASSRPKFPTHLNTLEEVEPWFTDSLKQYFNRRGINSSNGLVVLHSVGGYFAARTNMLHPELFKKLVLVSPLLITYPANPPCIPQWFKLLWERNISPFSLVRNAGPLGSFFLSGWSTRRFGKLSTEEQQLLHKYTYGIFNAPGSGEYVLNYLLLPGGVPRQPLINQIDKINCDLVWLYGEEDWMDVEGGERASQIVSESTPHNSTFKLISHAGHHIYLDNYIEFNNTIIQEMSRFEN